ncbi:MAG: hypothetical protein R3B48_06340 [Kofleriaceae bacterium]
MPELHEKCKRAMSWVADLSEPGGFDARFALPERVADYLAVLGDTSWFGHRVMFDLRLWSSYGIAQEVESQRRSLFDDEKQVCEAGLWLPLGAWSDKHEWYLCCDLARSQFGTVWDAHDDHPWLNGTSMMTPQGSFVQWLDKLGGRRVHRPGTALAIALTTEELADLKARFRSGPPEHVVWKVRDLEFAHTPDSAWQGREGHPSRLALLDDLLPPELVTPGAPEIKEGDAAIALLNAAEVTAFAEMGCGVSRWDTHQAVRGEHAVRALRDLAEVARALSGGLVLMRDLGQDAPDESKFGA